MRYKMACAATEEMILKGKVVYSPIVHTHPLHHYGVRGSWQDFWHENKAFMDVCDTVAVLMIPGWRESEGVQAEIEYAEKNHKSLLFLEAPDFNGGEL